MRETSFTNLRAFMDELRRDGELVIVEAPVSASLEVAEIHRRVIAAGGPALVFKNVAGSAFPVVTNLFGTADRAGIAFGSRPERLIKRLAGLAQTLLPPTLGKLWGTRDLVFEALAVGTKSRPSGPVTEVVTTDVRLDQLPVLTTWPGSPPASMRGTNERMPCTTPMRLMSRTHFQSSSVAVQAGPQTATPALLKMRCAAPKRA